MKGKIYNFEPAFGRPANILQVLENKALNIRKLLLQNEKYVPLESRGIFDDALKLSRTIENICSRNKNLSAANANTALDLVEIFFDQLEQKCVALLHQKSARSD